ncbi:hypothetical protein P170DRAFT_433812 [Aspergillus steynii IBT 23096]|uniref:Uncharacterized protein n=1 Tax=Aspergillus steynii IBT 23096 TaxID=1392250 RepID=A0A2I2GGC4_9EURO|nr:uncharacterized protein P170DRAFT_433812 [Aspergillus steynii IBT 23096]PLB51910.1 hypothetical protein P170DRAFT_433812 [Aspergillus steynii IBT 23096]
MAGDQDSNQNHHTNGSRGWPDDDNPFVAFRRFADEQISSMLQSVVGIPSMASSPSSSGWAVFADDPKYARDSHYRQRQNDNTQGTENPSDSDVPGASNNSENHPYSRSENPWRSHGFGRRGASPHDLFDLDFFDSFFDKFWFDDHTSRFFHPYQRPMFSNLVSDDSPAWPVTYLMFSPYSPLHLERQAQYRSHREGGVFSSLMSSLKPSSERDQSEPQWREAFEDLLRLENGKPMLDRGSVDTSKRESGKEWMQGLVKRGSLGDRWKYVASGDGRPWSTIAFDSSKSGENGSGQSERDHRNNAVKAGFSWDEEPESVTELDLYDRFLDDIEAREREFFRVRESPLLRLLLDDRYEGRDRQEPSRKEKHGDDAENWLELVSGGQRNSVPDTVPEKEKTAVKSSAAVDTPSVADQQSYVISTKTTTERVRLSDGSVQTKIVKTKRFADGREENNESVEVVNPPQHNQVPPADQDESSSNQNKDGWFWKGN